MAAGLDSLSAALDGLTGDVAALKAAPAKMQNAFDAAPADEDQAVSDAVAASTAEFEAALELLVARAKAPGPHWPAETLEA